MHAGVAVHTVAGIDSQPLPPSAEVAEGAVVNAAAPLIVPQPTDAAVVLAQPGVAIDAFSCMDIFHSIQAGDKRLLHFG